ncbi:hypothetical protein KQH65_12140, partial [archaeon]|nr:hypothetical protein [archaeon]
MTKSSKPSNDTSSLSKIERITKIQQSLPSIIDEVKIILDNYDLTPEALKLNPLTQEEAERLIEHILLRFHTVACTNSEVRKGEKVFTVSDEKETQDLLYGLLRLHFDDVRKEEPTESI